MRKPPQKQRVKPKVKGKLKQKGKAGPLPFVSTSLSPSLSPFLSPLAAEMERSILSDHLANIQEGCLMPGRAGVAQLLDGLLAVLFPGIFGEYEVREKKLAPFLRANLKSIRVTLVNYVSMALDFEARQAGKTRAECKEHRPHAENMADALLKALTTIRETLGEDLRAAYEGDPAATSVLEVLLSYPFVHAIATHRLAHELYRMRVPLLPRMLSEVAHSRTGIDIHPGAQIGPGFFIDHGTGVVIGETAMIGRGVKLYQGVTLGALSFPKDAAGNPIKGTKRHPNIEDNVTIYAGATVLGGETTIGRNSVIGGNCWITSSVPPDKVVMSERTRLKQRE
jgi:serine O-acetyltransferase